MKKPLYFLLFIFIFMLSCQVKKSEKGVQKVEPEAIPFKLEDVKLLDSPFKKAMQLNANWLLDLKPDRLLYRFRVSAGLVPKDSSYSGWEERFSGHTLGHYISACAMMYAASNDESFKERVDYIIEELDVCQITNSDGFVGGVRNGKQIFSEIKNGDIRLRHNGFELNGGRVPWYNMHKLFAGLIDAYVYAENEKAKDILIKLADWAIDLLSSLSDEQVQEMLLSEHGGMNESLATVYALTGEAKYLDLAKRFNHKLILDPLSESRDELDGQHANSQIPKVIGAIREFEFTGDSALFEMADFFWNTVVQHHSYVIGGNGDAEYLGPPDMLYDRIDAMTCENCGTYNMLKLTKHLFSLHPSVEKADYFERALYNQILASQNPKDGMGTYFEPLGSGSARNYCSPDKSFWCCTGTGMEKHAKYGEAIYFKDHQEGLYINLFIPSILNWEEKGLKLTQETGFPWSDIMTYKLQLEKPQKMSLKFRFPFWAVNGFNLEINGEKQSITANPGSYIEINRKWHDCDIVSYQLPMSLYSELALGSPKLKAFLYGPIVLAADLGQGIWDKPFPVLVSDNSKIENMVAQIEGEPLSFQTLKAVPENVKLIPYFKTGENTMMVYFNHFTKDEWNLNKEAYLSDYLSKKQLEERSVDWIKLGEIQSERDHSFKGHKTEIGTFNGCKFRKAGNEQFSFKMKVSPEESMELICTYWGDHGPGHAFDIFIDDEFLTNVTINRWGKVFIDKLNIIPLDLTYGKNEVVVKFFSSKGQIAGPVFECRMIK